jgi:capsular polysaccharide export protein
LEPGSAPANHRLVVTQNGPGDEIQLASRYPALQAESKTLTILCDPRLETLMTRSFPSIEFLPVERSTGRRIAGFLAPSKPPRADNDLYDLLTQQAFSLARGCDRVVLGRSLQQVAVDCEPADAYLRPDATLVESIRQRLPGQERLVGLCWRSELTSPFRDIHYLDVRELDPILAIDATFICVQHDATDEERIYLTCEGIRRVIFVDEIDLRDDFESTAALLSQLDAVVGVATSMVELGAAVGTPSVLMQPTLFGSWRRIDSVGHDYWYSAMRIAGVAHAEDRLECVRQGAKFVREILTDRWR